MYFILKHRLHQRLVTPDGQDHRWNIVCPCHNNIACYQGTRNTSYIQYYHGDNIAVGYHNSCGAQIMVKWLWTCITYFHENVQIAFQIGFDKICIEITGWQSIWSNKKTCSCFRGEQGRLGMWVWYNMIYWVAWVVLNCIELCWVAWVVIRNVELHELRKFCELLSVAAIRSDCCELT